MTRCHLMKKTTCFFLHPPVSQSCGRCCWLRLSLKWPTQSELQYIPTESLKASLYCHKELWNNHYSIKVRGFKKYIPTVLCAGSNSTTVKIHHLLFNTAHKPCLSKAVYRFQINFNNTCSDSPVIHNDQNESRILKTDFWEHFDPARSRTLMKFTELYFKI